MYLTADVNYYIVATGGDKLKDVKFCKKIFFSNKYRQYFSYFLSLKISYQKCSSFSVSLKNMKKLTITPSDTVVN